MAKRRGNKEGTIYKRPNGTWCAQVSIDGQRLTKYAPTQRECRAWLKETLAQVDQGMTADGSRVTLAAYLEHWLTIVEPSLRPNTWRQYHNITRRHILPDLGDIHLAQLRPDHLQGLYATKTTAGLGARTIQLIHTILHRSLGHAVEWGLIGRNPSDAVKTPQPPRHEMTILDAEQARRFLTAARDSRHQALFHLAITTGLRQGELLGLRWKDLNWDTGFLQIQRQLYRVTGQGLIFSEPKTSAGRRSIVLAAADLDILRQHRKQQLEERLFAGSRWQEQDLIFPTTIGTPLDQRNMTREFKAILASAGLQPLRFHDLRHTAASLMLQSGIHPKIVQERLGHSDITITLNTYSHVLPSLQKEAAETIAALLSS